MRILLVKTSSLGDVIHNLPVATDIRQHFPDAIIDWCVEDVFAAIPRLHPAVERVIPVAIRRWRKALFRGETWRSVAAYQREVRRYRYDLVIDTQGLIKSALVATRALGPRAGYDAGSAREPLAAAFYQHVHAVDRKKHAVLRNRELAAAALGYTIDPAVAATDYGIAAPDITPDWLPPRPYLVLLTATSRDDKLWPEAHWITLGKQLAERGFGVILPAGSAPERERAARLAAAIPEAIAAPPMSIEALAALLAGARAVVGVDTGLTHLAVALKVPTVALYTATEPGLTGVYGSGFHRNLGGRQQCPAVVDVLTELHPVLN